MLHMPVDVRNLSLVLLALFATVALLYWAVRRTGRLLFGRRQAVVAASQPQQEP